MVRVLQILAATLALMGSSGVLGTTVALASELGDDCCDRDTEAPEHCPVPCATCPGLPVVQPPPRREAAPIIDTRPVTPAAEQDGDAPPEPPRPNVFHPPRISP